MGNILPNIPRFSAKDHSGQDSLWKEDEMNNHVYANNGSPSHAREYILIFLCAGVLLALLGLFVYQHPEEIQTPVTSSAWVETITEAAPSGVPIMGYWADDVPPQIFCVVKVGTNYYEYTANPSVPGELLRSYDPDWWVSLPGGTK